MAFWFHFPSTSSCYFFALSCSSPLVISCLSAVTPVHTSQLATGAASRPCSRRGRMEIIKKRAFEKTVIHPSLAICKAENAWLILPNWDNIIKRYIDTNIERWLCSPVSVLFAFYQHRVFRVGILLTLFILHLRQSGHECVFGFWTI